MILKKYKFLLSFLTLGIDSYEADAQDFLNINNIRENYLGKDFITNEETEIDSSRTDENGQLVLLPKGTKIFFKSEEKKTIGNEERTVFKITYICPGMDEQNLLCHPEQAQDLSRHCTDKTEGLYTRIRTNIKEILGRAT